MINHTLSLLGDSVYRYGDACIAAAETNTDRGRNE